MNDLDEVVFLHLGRGAPKTFGTYSKQNRTSLQEWNSFIVDEVLEENI